MQGQRLEVDFLGGATSPISRVSTSSFHSGNPEIKELALKVRLIEQQLEVLPKVHQQIKIHEQKIHQLEEDNHLFRQINQKLLDEFCSIKQKLIEEQDSVQKSIQSHQIDSNLLIQQQQIQTMDILDCKLKNLKDELIQQQNLFVKQIENDFLLYQIGLRRKTSNSPKLREQSKTPNQINEEQSQSPFVKRFNQNPHNLSYQSSQVQNQKDSSQKSDLSQYFSNSNKHLVNLTQIQSRTIKRDLRQNFDKIHNCHQKLTKQMKQNNEISSQQHYLNVELMSNASSFQRNLSGSPVQRFDPTESQKSDQKTINLVDLKNKKGIFQLDFSKVKQQQQGTASSRF